MSGSSMDGLDIAACNFSYKGNKWTFSIQAAQLIPYTSDLKEKLTLSTNISGKELMLEHARYGKWVGQQLAKFINKNDLKPSLIASHGHTVFHEPEQGMSFQLGSPAYIAAECGVPAISDFRSLDLALGGLGAPLAPLVDQELFHEYAVCLNLGGIANISYTKNNALIGYDISACNLLLNHLSKKWGQEYDKDGALGRNGKLDKTLLSRLNELPYFGLEPPKAIDKIWVEKNVFPLLENTKSSKEDMLYTCYIHIGQMIGRSVNNAGYSPIDNKALLSGGGAKNSFLIKTIQNNTDLPLVIPEEKMIDFKECLLMAYLGLLRSLNKNNTIHSVTGAQQSSSGGGIYINHKI